jgi:hypothetical protein
MEHADLHLDLYAMCAGTSLAYKTKVPVRGLFNLAEAVSANRPVKSILLRP